MEDGPRLHMENKTTPKWEWPGSRDPISKYWDPPYNYGTNRDIRFKFGTDIEDGPVIIIIIIIIQYFYSAIMSYADTEALVAPV